MTWEAPRRTGEVQLKKFMVMGNGWVDRTTSEYAVVQTQWTYSIFSPISLAILCQFVRCMSLIGCLRSPKTASITVPQSPASHSTPPSTRRTPTPTLNVHHFLEACWNRVRGSKVGGDPTLRHIILPLLFYPLPSAILSFSPSHCLFHPAPPLCINPSLSPLLHSLSL